MAPRRKTNSHHVRELTVNDITYQIDYCPPKVTTSDDIEPCEEIIGQDRAIEGIKVGLHIRTRGYNIFVTGMGGTGRTTTIQHLLEQLNHQQPQLNDICYVNNFKNEDHPRVIVFTAGDGKRFKKDMAYLVGSMRKAVPKIFLSEDYKERQGRIVREYENRQKELINKFEEKLDTGGFVMVQIQAGLGVRNEIQPLIDNEPASLEKIERMVKDGKFPEARLDQMRSQWDVLRREFEVTSL